MDVRIKAVTFDAEAHRYFWSGKEFYGITGAIGKLMGKNYPETDIVHIATIYGHDVHAESEAWIKSGRRPSTEAGKWIVNTLEMLKENGMEGYEAELIVSDFEGTASCIDIVGHKKDGSVILFDIKTTSYFDRSYCSLQLSVYRKLYEACYGNKVSGLYVLGTKSARVFRIIDTGDEKVERVLDMNRRKACSITM